MMTYDISKGSKSVQIAKIVPQTGRINIQVVGTGLDSTITISLQESIDSKTWHDMPEEPITNLNHSSMLMTDTFHGNFLAVKVDVGTATTGVIEIFNPATNMPKF